MNRNRNDAENVLLPRYSVQIGIDGLQVPLIWVGPDLRPDLMRLRKRLMAVGQRAAQLADSDLVLAYGDIFSRWVYQFGTSNRFLLVVTVVAPVFGEQPAIKTQFAVHFNLEKGTDVIRLRHIAECERVLLRFEKVPDWVKQLHLSSRGEGARDMGAPGLSLVHTSLPLAFRSDLNARMHQRLDAWLGLWGESGGEKNGYASDDAGRR